MKRYKNHEKLKLPPSTNKKAYNHAYYLKVTRAKEARRRRKK